MDDTTLGLPGREGRFVKVVFPLPGDSATVLPRSENRPDGSRVSATMATRANRVHRTQKGTLRVRRVPTKETVHVYVDGSGALRADHVFAFAGVRFLTLRYGISPHDEL